MSEALAYSSQAERAEPFRPVRVLVLTRYVRRGASSRIRFLNVIDAISHTHPGLFQFTVQPLLDDRYISRVNGGTRQGIVHLASLYLKRLAALTKVMTFDVVWIEKEVFPGLPASVERLLAGLGIPYLVDYDDATFLWYEQHPSRLVRQLLGRKIETVVSRAGSVVAGSRALASSIKERTDRDAELIPTSVLSGDCISPLERRTSTGNEFRVGWIGTPSTSSYLDIYQSALARLQGYTDVAIDLIGASVNACSGLAVNRHAWSEAGAQRIMDGWQR